MIRYFPKWLMRWVSGFSATALVFNTVFVTAVGATTEAEQAAGIAMRMKTAMTAIEDGEREAARDRWDPAYIVQTIGIESSALYDWVRGNVRWVPYRGTLRGPVGVLMDRKGDSLDQALLLAELLKLSGHTVRLAHAGLPPNVARAELQRQIALHPVATVPGPLSPEEEEASVVKLISTSGVLDTADAYGMDPAALSDTLKSSVTRANVIANQIAQRMRTQSHALLPALTAQSAEAAGKYVIDEAQNALADHWWVQMSKDGQWIDLDLVSTDGNALAAPGETVDPAALTDTVEHGVTVRLVIGQWKEGKTSEAVALEQFFRPRDLIGKHIKLMQVPSLWPSNWPDVTPDDIQIKLRAALYTQSEWLPVFVVDDKQYMRASIMDTGVVNETPNSGDPFRRMTVPAVGQIVKATDILATIGDPDDQLAPDPLLKDPKIPRPEGELVGEWLEFEFRAPGEKPRTIRREIFDLIGPAARADNRPIDFAMSEEKRLARSMAALGETELLILPNALAPEFLLHLIARNALQNQELIDEIAGDPFGKAPANVVETFAKMTAFPAALFGFAAMRFDANPDSAQVYIDRPLVVMQRATLARGRGGDFHTRHALDIVENHVGIEPAAAHYAQHHRLLQGIVDTNTEAEALRMTNETVTANTGDAFAAALESGKRWTMLQPGEEARLAELKAPPDLRARMIADLAAGQIVVLSADGSASGWWRIDPVSGTTLGMGVDGAGAAMVEYALVIVIQTIISVAQCMFAQAATRAIEKTLEEVDKGKGYVAGAAAGLNTGKTQAQESFRQSQSSNHRHCAAMGLMGGFDAGLMMATFDLARYFAKLQLPVNPGGSGEPSGKGGSGEGKPQGGSNEPKIPENGRSNDNRPSNDREPTGDSGPPEKNPMAESLPPGDRPRHGGEGGRDAGPGNQQPHPRPTPEAVEKSIKEEQAAYDKAESEAQKLRELEKRNDQSQEGQKTLEEQRQRFEDANEEYEQAAIEAFRKISQSDRYHDWQNYRHGRSPSPLGTPPSGGSGAPDPVDPFGKTSAQVGALDKTVDAAPGTASESSPPKSVTPLDQSINGPPGRPEPPPKETLVGIAELGNSFSTLSP